MDNTHNHLHNSTNTRYTAVKEASMYTKMQNEMGVSFQLQALYLIAIANDVMIL